MVEQETINSKLALFLVGASIRAAAWSALRAGLSPHGVDLFADRDTADLCPVIRLPPRQYPHGLVRLAEDDPDQPWMYTGALENWPKVIEHISQQRPWLWGNGPGVLRRVRSPRLLFSCLREHDIPCPEVRVSPPTVLAQGRWLVKPRASAGGRNIAFWDGRRPPLPPLNKGGEGGGFLGRVFFQEFIEGQPCAAVYLGANGQAQLLGVTRQLVGEDWLQAALFHYCGSIGPLRLSDSLRARFARLGAVLAAGFGVQGLFGVDCILRDDVPYPVEVNPRYTASVEVLERAGGSAFMNWQRAVFAPASSTSPISQVLGRGFADLAQATPGRYVVGKAILFARQPLTFPSEGPWQAPDGRLQGDDFADIPHAGQRIGEGQPILSFFSRAPTVEACREKLQQTAEMLDRLLFGKYKQARGEERGTRGQGEPDSLPGAGPR